MVTTCSKPFLFPSFCFAHHLSVISLREALLENRHYTFHFNELYKG